jgi:uncharacterized membrane protein YphA (DoxX/SURF4 family)
MGFFDLYTLVSDRSGMPGIYVERRVRGSVDEVWRLTQTPEVHQRWDLRFTEIRYLPRIEGEPQRFFYATRWIPGIGVTGTGESVGERVGADGNASSALKFASGNWWSLIREGSGYWKYVPVADGVRFLTWYDYEVRFGRFGRAVDAVAFRPLIGWATAWSFDRLALWLEDGQTPEISMMAAVVYAVARVTIASVWIWHGLVPKLLFHAIDESRMLAEAGLPMDALPWFGWAEIVFGIAMLAGWRWRWMFTVNVVLMAAALMGVAVRSPQYVTAAFNPVTLNVCMIALAVVGLAVAKRVPTAARCMRTKPKEDE